MVAQGNVEQVCTCTYTACTSDRVPRGAELTPGCSLAESRLSLLLSTETRLAQHHVSWKWPPSEMQEYPKTSFTSLYPTLKPRFAWSRSTCPATRTVRSTAQSQPSRQTIHLPISPYLTHEETPASCGRSGSMGNASTLVTTAGWHSGKQDCIAYYSRF